MTVTLKKLGGSVAVVIPRAIAREMELTDGSTLDLTSSGGAITMRKRNRRPRRSMKEIVAGMKPLSAARRKKELDDGGPVGKEIW